MKTSTTWAQALKDANIYGLDIETTGTNPKTSMIYNIGVSRFSENPIHKNYFMPNVVDSKNLEESFLNAHKDISSKLFAKGQIERGVLDEYQKAISEGNINTIDKAFMSFTNLIEPERKGFILGQNLNFENRMFKEMVQHPENSLNQSLSKEVVKAYNQKTNRLSHRTMRSELFSQYDIEDIKQGVGLDTDSLQSKSKQIRQSIKDGNTSKIMSSMTSYSEHYDKVMDSYKSLLTNSDKGIKPVVDLQDITKAVYAKAALAGDLKPEYFDRAFSVDFLSKTLFSTPEKHLGMEDNISTKKIFDIMVQEYDKYSTVPGYKSSILQGVNTSIETTNEVSRAYLTNLKNQITESKDTTKAAKQVSNAFQSYSHIPSNEGFRQGVYTKTLEFLEQEGGMDKAIKYLDEVEITPHQTTTNKARAKITPPKSSNLKKNVLVGAGIFGASMMLSGEDKKSKYNTYDELYNDQYYGSGFADWQNRDRSHSFMYKGDGW